MDISIIIVSWNVKDLLEKNLKTLYSTIKGVNFEVIVVDNNSSDGSAAMAIKEFPQAKVIYNNKNLGFAKANNQGIEIATGKYILLLNPDMQVMPATIEGMIKWMDEHPKVGIAGPQLIDSKGNNVPHVRRLPTLKDQLAIMLKITHIFPKILDKYLYRDFDYTKEGVVDSIRGSFFMIREDVVKKIGGLDELYFVWFEEVDYCRQARNAGWEIMYTPVVQCLDHVGQSFQQVKRVKTQKMFTESMVKYFAKWEPKYKSIILRIFRPWGIFVTWLIEKIGVKKDNKIRN